MSLRKRKKPRFHRQLSHVKIRVRPVWRRPRGKDSNQKRCTTARGRRPNPGYGQPREIWGLHPSGFSEVLVFNPSMLEGVDPKTSVVRIAGGVGRKKRIDILKKAGEKKIRVLNAQLPKLEKKTVTKTETKAEEKGKEEGKGKKEGEKTK